jgi:acetyltransferase-like isoleucine patch superfamily enzyme
MATTSWRRSVRFLWAASSVVLLETVLFTVSLYPVLRLWRTASESASSETVRMLLASTLAIPAYLLFALSFMLYSALATKVLGWRTAEHLDEPLNEFSWPVLNWGRYCMTIHTVRVLAGPAFRSTTLWNLYMRLNGARLGRLVWVNSLSLMDHNLLDFGDAVVIGSDVHLSGHVVEHGRLKTKRVQLGAGTVIGVGSVLGIGVTSGAQAQVGPLSFVPKHTHLEAASTYLGVPVHKLH